jgi:hypothetical protein
MALIKNPSEPLPIKSKNYQALSSGRIKEGGVVVKKQRAGQKRVYLNKQNVSVFDLDSSQAGLIS